jgi:hypothetical protein
MTMQPNELFSCRANCRNPDSTHEFTHAVDFHWLTDVGKFERKIGWTGLSTHLCKVGFAEPFFRFEDYSAAMHVSIESGGAQVGSAETNRSCHEPDLDPSDLFMNE